MVLRAFPLNCMANAVIAAFLISFTACAQPLSTRERGTLAGGGLGAATGAIVGAATGAPGAGAAIGGALGAIAGAITSDQLQAQDSLLAAQQQDIQRMREQIYRQQMELSRLRNEQ